jgi:uncharacterized protein YecE (DUF72 family)
LKPEIHIGPAGWSYPDWNGVVYPQVAGSRFDPLAYMAEFFDLVEINNTFYRIPTPRISEDWTKRVAANQNFCFTAKVYRDFTHANAPTRETDVDNFKSALDPIMDANKLGSLLVQFPWSFKMSDATRRYVRNLTKWLRPFPSAVEVRHGSWGSPAGRRFFQDNGIPLCGIDQPVIGDSLGPATYEPGGGQAYFRLHGRNRRMWFKAGAGRNDRYNYLYSPQELSSWRERIDSVPASVERLFVVLNNHFRGQAVANALQLRSMLTGHKQDAPRELLDTYPRLNESLRPTKTTPRRRRPRGRSSGQIELFEDDDQQKHGDDPDQDR